MCRHARWIGVLLALLAPMARYENPAVRAEDPADQTPRVALANPLAVRRGEATKVMLRGWKLDQASQVRSASDQVSVKLLGKGSAPVPGGQNAEQIGDTQVELELLVPAECDLRHVSLVVVTPSGTSARYVLQAGSADSIHSEREPNDGFAQAQLLASSAVLSGDVRNDRDVDVYALDLEAGDRLTLEVQARQLGSALDSLLTLFDARGNILRTDDDTESTDSRLEFAAARAGRYHVVLQDAHDRGGPAHPYRLLVTVEPAGHGAPGR